MPKSNSVQHPAKTSTGGLAHIDDAALRKKRKNADAQALFRARRSKYVASLEQAGENSILNCSLPPATELTRLSDQLGIHDDPDPEVKS